MSNAVLKNQDMQVPERNKGIVARPRPALSVDSRTKQVEKAFALCFANNKDGLELLAKI